MKAGDRLLQSRGEMNLMEHSCGISYSNKVFNFLLNIIINQNEFNAD